MRLAIETEEAIAVATWQVFQSSQVMEGQMRVLRVAWFLLLVLGSANAADAAAPLTFPGAAPCNTTLQACITGASAGDTIQIATNGPIAESPNVPKSLTIQPAAGFVPVVNGSFFLSSTGTPADITVQNLTINGTVRGSPGTADLSVHILNNTISISGGFSVAIDVSSGTFPPYGNVTSEIRGNTVTVTGGGQGNQCIGILGNAIIALNGPGEAMTADIIGNRVDATGTNDGIECRNFQQAPNSTLDCRIINNLVTGQLSEAGFPGAIVVSADGFSPITVQVVNNTVANNQGGIGVSARTDLGASITGVVANNIIANSSSSGLFIDSSVAVSNNNNLLFHNGFNDFTPGPVTLHLNPKFVGGFHLASDSPAINAGSNAQVPPDITTDLDGNARIQFSVVDIGAFETSVPGREAAAIPTLSWPGQLAFLVALIGLGASVLVRRA
ncbi:MAG: hypothetical protein DMD81_20020 [Candidatus Rokuibacteriota bacterium]|nr:MAG: hypothetical protein DMD81_20020 [Candidatus Rokubacteria bacterium]